LGVTPTFLLFQIIFAHKARHPWERRKERLFSATALLRWLARAICDLRTEGRLQAAENSKMLFSIAE
jgi:hypothetical protein